MISQLCLFGLLLEGNYFLLVSAAVLGERVPPHISRPRDGSCAPHSLLGTCNPLCHGTLRTQGLSLVPVLLVRNSPALLFVMSSHTPTAAAETQLSRTEAAGNARRWDSFAGCSLYLFSHPSA